MKTLNNLNEIIYNEHHGKYGHKAELFLQAVEILKKTKQSTTQFSPVKPPRTWFLTSDMSRQFLKHNQLEYLLDQKYFDLEKIRLDFPNITKKFEATSFPDTVSNDLALLLHDLNAKPLIVRSSGVLSGHAGTEFYGKYSSIFLTNIGSKKDRLDNLKQAISRVYASMFSPESIQYRKSHGLIDYSEELGIMIQETVGTPINHYFLPAFSGIAFSRNEFPWSPRIKQNDGLIRMVPGLGTRAVNYFNDDYPVLIAPGQPGLFVNTTPDEIKKYSPRKIDGINMKMNTVETMDLQLFFSQNRMQIPWLKQLISTVEDNHVRPFNDVHKSDSESNIVTFRGLLGSTPFAQLMDDLLKTFEKETGEPVQIEFASDGNDLYLLQYRPQKTLETRKPAAIPKNIALKNTVFTAKRHVSNGILPDLSHIVYVDCEQYSMLRDPRDFQYIAQMISRLNQILPKRRFILMGPGRWGSKGDVKLGVPVTFADISHTAMLIEIARESGDYLPELSFGTHFFHDLFESRIRYLPLYPSDHDTVFNERFLRRSKNLLPDLLPQFKQFKNVVHVIEIPEVKDGQTMTVVMNGELQEAMGFTGEPYQWDSKPLPHDANEDIDRSEFWKWRLYMAEQIALRIEPDRFGVKAIYLFGSTKNATAGPGSDIDLILHVTGNHDQLMELKLWLEGWSLSLSEINYLRTGYRTDGLLDVHFVTDEDIENQTSYASKIGAITDAARPLSLKLSQ